MSIKEDVIEVQEELKKVKQEEQSLAMSLLQDMKKTNKRMFIIIIILISLWFATIGYLVFVLNDIETVTTEETIEVEQDSGDNGNNNFVNGNENEVNN